MKKKKVKEIKQKLIGAVEKVLTDNNTDLIVKIERDLNKSIKEVSKKSNKKVMQKKRLTSDKKQHEVF